MSNVVTLLELYIYKSKNVVDLNLNIEFEIKLRCVFLILSYLEFFSRKLRQICF